MTSRNGRKPPNPVNVPKQHGRRPSNPATARRANGRRPAAPPPRQSDRPTCCSMVAATRAARRGQWRLARRYAVWSVRFIAARMA